MNRVESDLGKEAEEKTGVREKFGWFLASRTKKGIEQFPSGGKKRYKLSNCFRAILLI